MMAEYAAIFRTLAFLRYHVDREHPAASHGRCAGRLGPIPCALRQRSDRRRFFSRFSSSVIMLNLSSAAHVIALGISARLLLRQLVGIFGGILINAGDLSSA
jgi:hypothetical protein